MKHLNNNNRVSIITASALLTVATIIVMSSTTTAAAAQVGGPINNIGYIADVTVLNVIDDDRGTENIQVNVGDTSTLDLIIDILGGDN